MLVCWYVGVLDVVGFEFEVGLEVIDCFLCVVLMLLRCCGDVD